MPTYEYICENNHHFEEFQSMVSAPIEVCPVCGGKAVRQISGGSGLIFKGSGFYITDYAKKNVSGGDSKSSEKKAETQSELKSETKTESKSESTTPAKPDSSTEKKSTTKES